MVVRRKEVHQHHAGEAHDAGQQLDEAAGAVGLALALQDLEQRHVQEGAGGQSWKG